MSLASRDYSEKRNFIRMQMNTPVEIILEPSKELLNGTCLDLSGSGLQVLMDRSLPTGSKMEISIKPPYGDSPIMRANAEVTRVDEANDEYLVGLEILEMLA